MSTRAEPRARKILRNVKWPLRQIRGAYSQLTAPLRGLPSVLIIGAQKSGTTSLFTYLLQHPEVLPPVCKEVHYFDFNYRRGVRWYRGHFPLSHRLRNGALTLDASPYYLVHPLVPRRAAELLPEARLVVLLRNPIDRALSHYQHEVRGGRETLSFAEALEREPERLAQEEERLENDPDYYSYNHHRYTYTRRGLYLEQLRRWAQHFPRSRLLVLQSEKLFQEPARVTASVHDFLGLRHHRLRLGRPFVQQKYDRSMPAELRTRLATYFEPHNRELFRWLGQEFDWS